MVVVPVPKRRCSNNNFEEDMERLEFMLRANLGNFVPSGRRYLVDRTWSRKFGPFVMKPLFCDNEAVRSEVREYARDTFYKDAVVPSSLGLWKSDKEADSIFEKEMDLYVDSGASFVLCCDQTGELKGFFLNCIWPRDPSYEAIRGFNMSEWHRVSAKIAMHVCPERPEPLWRDLQYQHLYNECQITMAKNEQDFCIYFGPGYMVPEARGLGISKAFFHELGKLTLVNCGICMSVPTVEALRNREENKTFSTELGHISYTDQVLQTSDGKMVFGDHAEKGGMSLMMSDGSKFPMVFQFVIAMFQVLMKTSLGQMLVEYILFLEYYFRTWFNKT